MEALVKELIAGHKESLDLVSVCHFLSLRSALEVTYKSERQDM